MRSKTKNRAVFSWVLVRSPEEVPDECGFGSTRRVSLRWRDGGRPRRVARTVAPETQRPKNRKTSPVLGFGGSFSRLRGARFSRIRLARRARFVAFREIFCQLPSDYLRIFELPSDFREIFCRSKPRLILKANMCQFAIFYQITDQAERKIRNIVCVLW